MPYTLTVEPALVRSAFFGVMTAAVLFAMAAEMRTVEQARPVPHNRLTDLSEVTDIQLTVADVPLHSSSCGSLCRARSRRGEATYAGEPALLFAHKHHSRE